MSESVFSRLACRLDSMVGSIEVAQGSSNLPAITAEELIERCEAGHRHTIVVRRGGLEAAPGFWLVVCDNSPGQVYLISTAENRRYDDLFDARRKAFLAERHCQGCYEGCEGVSNDLKERDGLLLCPVCRDEKGGK